MKKKKRKKRSKQSPRLFAPFVDSYVSFKPNMDRGRVTVYLSVYLCTCICIHVCGKRVKKMRSAQLRRLELRKSTVRVAQPAQPLTLVIIVPSFSSTLISISLSLSSTWRCSSGLGPVGRRGPLLCGIDARWHRS
jgi:hypothetical protein